MKPMTNAIREKIQMYVKNGADISELIADVSIKGENLDKAVIKKFSRFNDDFSGTSFVRAVIGEEGKVTNIAHAKSVGCNFKYARFLGTWDARHWDARNINFCGTYAPDIDYRWADLRGCTFCGAVFSFSDWKGHGAKFDKKVFEMIFKHWGIDIQPEGETSV